MPYLFQQQSVSINKHAIFDLGAEDAEALVGLRYLQMSFGNDTDHEIDHIKLRLLPRRLGQLLYVNVIVLMDDTSGNRLRVGDSEIIVACISKTGNSDALATLLEVGGLGGGLRPVNLSDGLTDQRELKDHAVVLSGFDASYPGDDHHVREFSADTVFLPAGRLAGIASADLLLKDSSGNIAAGATADLGLVAAVSAPVGSEGIVESELRIGIAPDVQLAGTGVRFDTRVGQTTAMISGFRVVYPGSDHHVRDIRIGAPDDLVVDGDEVILSDRTGARMRDDSGHSQADDRSGVTMTVFALPLG